MEAKGIISLEQLRYLLTVADYHPEWREQMISNRFTAITRVDGRRLWQAGDISTSDFITLMRSAGYSPENAPLVAQAQIRQAQGEQRTLLLTNLKKAFKDGWIDENALVAGFQDLELPASQLAYQVTDAQADRDTEELEELRDALRDAFRKDLIDSAEYYTHLTDLGMMEWKASLLLAREQIRKGEWPFE